MAYNRFQDDDEKAAPARSVGAFSLEITSCVYQLTASFNQLDGAFKNVEQQCMRLYKCQNYTDLHYYYQNIDQYIRALYSVNLPQIQQSLLQFYKNAGVVTDAAQRTQLQALDNKFTTLYNAKKQQISNFSASFAKMSARVTYIADDSGNPAQSLQNFYMQMIYEEVDEQLDQIKEINGEMVEINNLMKTMATNVYKGGQTIELISDRVKEADDKVVRGVDNLQKAKEVQKSKNKWLFWGLGVVAIIVVVLLLVFLL